MDAVAFDLLEVGAGEGVARSFRYVRQIYENEVRSILSTEVVLCCRTERKAFLDLVRSRLGVELKYNPHRKSIGVLTEGQRIVLIEVYNIESGKLVQEQDLHDEEQVRKSRLRFKTYVATKSIYQPILTQKWEAS